MGVLQTQFYIIIRSEHKTIFQTMDFTAMQQVFGINGIPDTGIGDRLDIRKDDCIYMFRIVDIKFQVYSQNFHHAVLRNRIAGELWEYNSAVKIFVEWAEPL